MNKDIELIYRLDGKTIDEIGINVNDLAPILLSLGSMIEEGNKILYPNGQSITVNVKPFEKGSFIVDISVFYNAWEGLTNLLNNSNLENIKKLLEWIGLIGGTTGLSVIGLLRFLKGAPRNVETINKNEVKFTNESGQSMTVNINVQKLYNSGSFHTGIEQSIVEPLKKEGIDRIETYLKSDEIKTRTEINKEDVKDISNSLLKGEIVLHSDDETNNEQIIYLHPKKVDLEGDGRAWRFRKAGSKEEMVYATIKDELFLKKPIHFSKGDLLKVKMVTKQKFQNGRATFSNEIIEVIEYKPGAKQGELF